MGSQRNSGPGLSLDPLTRQSPVRIVFNSSQVVSSVTRVPFTRYLSTPSCWDQAPCEVPEKCVRLTVDKKRGKDLLGWQTEEQWGLESRARPPSFAYNSPHEILLLLNHFVHHVEWRKNSVFLLVIIVSCSSQ